MKINFNENIFRSKEKVFDEHAEIKCWYSWSIWNVWEERVETESRIGMYTLRWVVKQIASAKLLRSTGSSAQPSVVT